MSLPAMSLGDWFCMSRKGGTGRGKLVHPEGENSMAMSGLGCGNPLVILRKCKWTLKAFVILHTVFKANIIYAILCVAWRRKP